jgi:hypothetical protein
MIKDILVDRRAASVATKAVKEYVDDVYGYSKYDIDEIRAELSGRLLCMTYLGYAVYKIISDDKVKDSLKVSLASRYLSLIDPYVRGKLPKEVYKYWSEMDPEFVVEAAAFLDSRGAFDWNDMNTIGYVIRLSMDSGVSAKKAFLSRLIERLNRDARLLSFFSKNELHQYDIFSALTGGISMFGLNGMRKGKRLLVQNLVPLLDADWRDSSFGELCRLSTLSNDDLSYLFMEMNPMPFKKLNRVKAFMDLAEGLAEKGISLGTLLKGIAKHKKGFFYADEPKVKALCEVAEEKGQVNEGFVKTIRGFLKEKMETETREYLFKFVYRHTRDRGILQDAMKWKASGIRKWAESELAKRE